MLPLGLSCAASVRVSNALGANLPNAARRSARAAAGLTACTQASLAAALILGRNVWGRAFTDLEEVGAGVGGGAVLRVVLVCLPKLLQSVTLRCVSLQHWFSTAVCVLSELSMLSQQPICSTLGWLTGCSLCHHDVCRWWQCAQPPSQSCLPAW